MRCSIEELNRLAVMFPDTLLVDLINYLNNLREKIKKDVDKTK